MKRRAVHHAARRRGGAWPLAARAQQAERDAAHRRAACPQPRTIRNFRPASRRSCRGWQQLGWTDRPQRADRHPLGRGQCRRHSQTRGGIGRARAGRHPGRMAARPWGRCCRRPAPCRSCSRSRRRSGRRRLRRQPGAAGRQRHRFHAVRIQPEREMAGAAQADRARRDASGGPSGSRHTRRDRPVRRHPGRGAVARGGGEPGQRARRRRDRARRRGLRARPEWRPDRDGERVGDAFIAI